MYVGELLTVGCWWNDRIACCAFLTDLCSCVPSCVTVFSTVSLCASTVSLCASTVTVCQHCVTVCQHCVTVSSTVSLCASTVSLCASTVSLCASTVSLCASTVSLCASTVSLCASTVSLCASTVSLCASTVSLCASSVSLCASSVSLCASTVSLCGVTDDGCDIVAAQVQWHCPQHASWYHQEHVSVAPSPSPRLSCTLKWTRMILGIRKLTQRFVVIELLCCIIYFRVAPNLICSSQLNTEYLLSYSARVKWLSLVTCDS